MLMAAPRQASRALLLLLLVLLLVLLLMLLLLLLLLLTPLLRKFYWASISYMDFIVGELLSELDQVRTMLLLLLLSLLLLVLTSLSRTGRPGGRDDCRVSLGSRLVTWGERARSTKKDALLIVQNI